MNTATQEKAPRTGEAAQSRPYCFGQFSALSPSARAENDCDRCASLTACAQPQLSARPVYSIRFPMKRERARVGDKRKRTWQIEVAGLDGARFCAAKMICSALLYRDHPLAKDAELVRAERLAMRSSALMARAFAGQISTDDPRIDEALKGRRDIINSRAARFLLARLTDDGSVPSEPERIREIAGAELMADQDRALLLAYADTLAA